MPNSNSSSISINTRGYQEVEVKGYPSSGQTPGTTSVTDSSTEIVATNTSRRWCFLTNIGSQDVYVAIGQTAILNRGILLAANGGSLAMGADTMSTEAINGITSTGTSNVIFQEGNE